MGNIALDTTVLSICQSNLMGKGNSSTIQMGNTLACIATGFLFPSVISLLSKCGIHLSARVRISAGLFFFLLSTALSGVMEILRKQAPLLTLEQGGCDPNIYQIF